MTHSELHAPGPRCRIQPTFSEWEVTRLVRMRPTEKKMATVLAEPNLSFQKGYLVAIKCNFIMKTVRRDKNQSSELSNTRFGHN